LKATDLEATFKTEQLLRIPPGFERGLGTKDVDAKKIDIQSILDEESDLLNELLREEMTSRELEKKSDLTEKHAPRENNVISNQESKEVDDLVDKVPSITTIIKPFKPKSKITEWVQEVDVTQDFPDFYSLVPELALKVRITCSNSP
jgi:hypothetical protein